MMHYLQSILLATDFRPSCEQAEQAVIRMASAQGSRVTLLHVLNPLLNWPTKMAEIRRQADAQLQIVAERLTAAGVKLADVELAQGQQSDTIIRKGFALGVDVIVIGAGETGNSDRFHAGPMAEAIMQHSIVPVLAVRPGEPALTFQNILCPVDHSAASQRGLQNAVSLAHIFGGTLTVLSIVPDAGWLSSVLETGKVVGAVEEHDRKWQTEFESFLEQIDFGDVTWHKEVRHGIPHQEIVAAVQERNADLLVMGCTGRSGLGHMLVGGTMRRLLRHLPCSVLAVKAENVLENVFDDDIRAINMLYAEGVELLQTGVCDSAREKFGQVLRRNPYHLRALEGYAEACIKVGQKQEAEIYRHRINVLRQQEWS